jgi:hypothetical protein
MKYGQKLKLGDADVTPRNIQEVQASKLGDAQACELNGLLAKHKIELGFWV